MSAKTALELGAPIRGVLAFTSTSMYVCLKFIHISYPLTLLFPNFSDKAGRSVPAPGRGALTVAREIQSKHPLPILDVAYPSHSRQMAFRRNQISEWLLHEHNQIECRRGQGEAVDEDYISSRIADIETEASRQEKHALTMYGILQDSDPRIAPLRRALAVWGPWHWLPSLWSSRYRPAPLLHHSVVVWWARRRGGSTSLRYINRSFVTFVST
jgi:fatty acid synthase subunit alpha, fungi type